MCNAPMKAHERYERMIKYCLNEKLSAEDFIDILERSGLSERRPVDQPHVIEKMVDHANLLVSARDENNQLVGLARCVTDYVYCCYLSCLAVDKNYQRQGIGKAIIKVILNTIGEQATLLLSAPGVENYYLKSGFKLASHAYLIKPGEQRDNVLKIL